jgi:hypothetical protein
MIRRAAAAAALALAGLALAAPPAGAAVAVYTTQLSGANEVPGPGSTTGTGTARVTVNTTSGRICWVIRVRGIGANTELGIPTAAHLHEAPAGQPGPVDVPLSAPRYGTSAGCTTNLFEAQEIFSDPSGYYVNVHTTEFPGGALRGQLL